MTMQPQTAPTTPISVNSLHQQPQNAMYVGPFRLEKTLGKGQTGLVKLGVHYKTNKKVAIKIVNREKLTDSVLMKVEREITIMKLIEHPHVLRLYDVYENKKYLYLVLEHVSGGELFDYLVKKSRLTTKEARKFFKQIISALDFCHSHLICHRDLKPENLLLDDKLNIKIADFGMASLQVDGSMLETSCGSPHYACPEVIRGEKYDGRKADVWSCGVILYALLVGALPFDDDNLKQLLEKIKKGTFQIPSYVPQECQDLLNRMIEVDPNKRMTLEEVNKHQWVLAGSKEEIELELPMSQVVQTAIIPSIESIDTDVLSNMTSLGSFKDQNKLVDNLLNERHNTEKVIYFLLLDRKLKNPCSEDHDEVFIRNKSTDAPRKRVDKFTRSSPGVYSQLTIGSPAIPRRGMPISHGRHQSCHTTPLQSPCTSPLVSNKELHFRNYDTGSIHSGSHSYRHNSSGPQSKHHHHPPSLTSQSSTEQDNISLTSNSSINFNQQLRSKINSVKNHLFSTPKFYKRKSSERSNEQQQQSVSQQPSTVTTPSSAGPSSQQTSSSAISTPTTDSKSWFHRWNFSTNSNNSNNNNSYNSSSNSKENNSNSSASNSSTSPNSTSQQDKEYVHIINDRPFSNLKADLIHVLLKTNDLIHNIITPCVFRCEYRSPDKFLSRNVRFKVEVITENQSKPLADIENKQQNQTCKILFTLMSGSTRQFQAICKNICQAICSNQITSIHQQRLKRLEQRQQQQQQQQVQVNAANTNTISNSINYVLQQQQQQQQVQQPNRSLLNTPTSRRNSNTSVANGIILNAPSPSSTSSSTSSTSSSTSGGSTSSASSTTAVGGLVNPVPVMQAYQQQQENCAMPIISSIESLQVSSQSTIPYNNPPTPISATIIANNNVNRTRRNSNTSMNSPTLNSNNFMYNNQQYSQQVPQQQQQIPQLQGSTNQSNSSISSVSNYVSTTTSSSSSINTNTNSNLYTQPLVTVTASTSTAPSITSVTTTVPTFTPQNKTQSQTSLTSSSKSSSSNSMNTSTSTTTKAQASANIAAAALSAMSIKAALFTTLANNITNFNNNNANNTIIASSISSGTSSGGISSTQQPPTTTTASTSATTTTNARNSSSNTSIFSSSSILDLFR